MWAWVVKREAVVGLGVDVREGAPEEGAEVAMVGWREGYRELGGARKCIEVSRDFGQSMRRF